MLFRSGWGAKLNQDGVSATVCMNDGDTHNTPSEQVETKYPLIVECYELRPDSGGAGKYRGGLGARRITQALGPLTVGTAIERANCRPWGLDGGKEAAGNFASVRIDNKWEENLPNAKLVGRRLKKGDALLLASGGGGGFGDPYERPAEKVAEDVIEGYVSVESALKDYGVAVDANGAIDDARTKELRSRSRA